MKIHKKINRFAAVAAAALGLSLGTASASAAFINGSISFADGFTVNPALVSTATFFDINSGGTSAVSAFDDFATFVFPPQGVTSAGNIDTLAPGGTLYDIGGFTFSWGSISLDTSTALTCNGAGLCTDTRTLDIQGVVTGNGFDPTNFIAVFTANGSCLGAAGACTGGYAPSWSSSVVATGTPPEEMPTPGVLALMSIGLLGLSYQRRRKA